jgi:hypothetical protein
MNLTLPGFVIDTPAFGALREICRSLSRKQISYRRLAN